MAQETNSNLAENEQMEESSESSEEENNKKELQLTPGSLFENRYTVMKKLGQGGFGAVYEVRERGGGPFALKIESKKTKCQVTKIEVAVLKILKSKHGVPFHGCGTTDKLNFILMGLVGQNLGALRRKCPAQKFSTGTSIRLIRQCVQAIEDLHRVGYVHRDIKPSNFAIGFHPHQQTTIFILDFGLARSFRTASGKLRPEREKAGFRGTIRFCSLNAHRGKELGRHDDLISCMYMLMEFLKGKLPWRHITDKKETKRAKKETANEALLSSTPEELHSIMHHLEKQTFSSEPNYRKIKEKLVKITDRRKFSDEKPLDWMKGGRYYEYFKNSETTPHSKTDPKESDRTESFIEIESATLCTF